MAPATVLLIDSDQDSLTIYSLILRHHGYEVVPAGDGDTGMKLAIELNPDIVVSELFLPFVKGRTFLQGLRSDSRTARKPVILLDSIPIVYEELLGGEAVTTRLTKPCLPTRLVEEVKRLLSTTAMD